MNAFFLMLINVLIFVALALPGFILVKTKILKTSESGALSKLLTYVGMPFLILSSTLGIKFESSFILVAVLSAVGCIALTILVFFITLILTKKENDDKKRGMMRFAMTFSNNGFLGIPRAMAVFGATHVIVSIVIILNILNNIIIFTLGVYLISGDKTKISFKKAFLNPVLIAFILGLVLNLVGIKNLIPQITTYSDHLKNIVTPISMIILGIKLADVPFKSLFTSKSCYYVSAIKLVFVPFLATLLGFALKFIFSLSDDIVMGFFIGFAMPTAGLASTFADQYKGDTINSVIYTLGSTIFSVLSIPILYFLLNLIIVV